VSKVVEISPTTRHEGHTKLVLKVNDQGIIERGDWLSLTPVRGIEKLAIGKSMHQVPKISSRVCGICPVAHTLAGIEAMEASICCEIPEDAYLLRVILQCANRLHSHALHNILTLPDMYLPGTETHINPFTPEEPVRSVAKRIQKLREIAQTVGEVVGGEPIHPSNPRVGGMYKNITPRAKAKIYDLAKEGSMLAREHMDFMITVLKDWENRPAASVPNGPEVEKTEKFGYHDQGYMAVDPLYGNSSLDVDQRWFPERWTEVRPWDWYMGETEITLEDPNYSLGGTTPAGAKAWPQMEACTGVPLYDGVPIEVGPRARLSIFRNYDHKGAMGLQIARQMEYPDCLYSMIEAVDALDTSGSVLADEIPQGDGSLGWCANEAPRGTDVHLAKVKDGKVAWYSLLVPTTWNFPTCSRALEGAPWQLAEVIVRAYDPCVSCATHMLVVDESKKVVAQKLVQ